MQKQESRYLILTFSTTLKSHEIKGGNKDE